MKNAIKVICFVIAVIIIGTASAYVYLTWDIGEFEYSPGTQRGTVVIDSYIGKSVNIVIPKRLRGRKVVSIGEKAFSETNIESVKIGNNVKSIGKNAFVDCVKLKSVEISDEVQSIGEMAFTGCSVLESVKITSPLNKLDSPVFALDPMLPKIDFGGETEKFVCEGGVIYNADKTVLYEAVGKADLSSYVIPSTVTEFKPYALAHHTEIKSIEFPSGVKKLPSGILNGCTGLKQLTIPDGVTTLGVGIVSGSGVTEIRIPASVKSIVEGAFINMEKQLTIVTVENSWAAQYGKTNNIPVKIVDSL